MKNYKRYYLDPLKVRNLRILWRLYLTRLVGFPLLLLFMLFGIMSVYRPAYAISKTWDGGCGADTTWSCANNWADNIVPVAGDTVTFNATSTNNSTVDSGFAGTVTSVTISSGYTGTVSLARSLTTSSSFNQSAGSFNGSNQTLTVGSFVLSGGTFTAPSTTLIVSSGLTISGSPTFNHNGGTLSLTGSGGGTLSCNNVTFNLVAFNNSGTAKTVNSNCSLPLGNNPNLPGLILNGTISGSGTLTMSAGLTLNAGATLNGFTGIVVNSSGFFTNSGATTNFGSYTTVDFNGAFTLSSGSFTAPSGAMTAASTFTVSAGSTFNANSGTVTFDGTAGATLSCNNTSFNLVTFNHTTGTKTVSNDCSLPLGTSPTITGPLALSGTLTGSGTMTTSSTYTRNTGSSVTGFTGIIANSTYTISGAAVDQSTYTTADFNGAFLLTTGSYKAPSGVATFASTFTLSSGTTFDANGGTVTFDGAGATLSCNNATFNLVTFAHTGSTKTVNSDCSLPLGSNPTVARAVTLNGTLSGSGTLTNPSGPLTLNSGAVLSGFSGLNLSSLTVAGATANFGGYTSFVTSSTVTLSSGSLTLPSGADLNLGLVISGGTFNAPSGTMTVAGALTISGSPTFNANGGTVTFDGGAATLSCNNATFNLVTFAHTTNTKMINSNCSLPLGNNPTEASGGSGGITLNGTLSGSGTLNWAGTGTITLNNGSSLAGFSGLSDSGGFVIDNATYNLGAYSPFMVSLGFTLQNGANFTAPSGVMAVGRDLTINSGTIFNANGGTVNSFGPSGGTWACNNTVFTLVTFTHNANKTINSDCNLPLGNNPVLGVNANGVGGGIILNGTLAGTGTMTLVAGQAVGNARALTLNNGSNLSGFNGLVVEGSLVLDNSTYDFGSYNTLDVDTNFTLQNGAVFTAPTGTMTVAGIFSNSATFNANSGTVIFDGSIDQTPVCNGTTFNKVVINKSGGNFTVDGDCSFPLGANPTVTLAAAYEVFAKSTISGSGTFNLPVGTLTLALGSSLSGFSGLTVNNLTIDGATADFGSYTTLDVNGDFTILKPGVFTAPTGAFNVAGNISTVSSEGHLRLPGTSGNYASAPDSAALSVTGDIDIRVKAALDSWTPGIAPVLLSKSINPSDIAYQLSMNSSGALAFGGSNNGTLTVYSATSTAAISATNHSTLWVRVTRNATTGDVTFYTSVNGTTWSQLGSVVSATPGAIYDSAVNLKVGTNSSGSGPVAGKFYHAQIRNNILDNGTGIVFDADFTNHADGTTSFAESSSNAATVTINGSDAHLYSDGAGTFNANGGTVVLDGGDQTIAGATTFHNLTKSVSSAATLTLPAGVAQTIQGALTLKGLGGHVLSLVSSTPGSQWQIDAQGARSLSYLGVKDSRNVNGSTLVACSSTNNGNNTGWSFNPGSCTASGGGSGSTTSNKASSSSSEDSTGATTEELATPTESPKTVSVPGSPDATFAQVAKGGFSWIWRLLGLFILLGFIFILVVSRRRKSTGVEALQPTSTVYEPGQRGDHE